MRDSMWFIMKTRRSVKNLQSSWWASKKYFINDLQQCLYLGLAIKHKVRTASWCWLLWMCSIVASKYFSLHETPRDRIKSTNRWACWEIFETRINTSIDMQSSGEHWESTVSILVSQHEDDQLWLSSWHQRHYRARWVQFGFEAWNNWWLKF